MSWRAEVDPVQSSFITGRLRRGFHRSPAPPIELWIDGAFQSSEVARIDDPEPVEFRIPLPRFCFDGQEHALEVRHEKQILKQQFRSKYDGYADPFSHNLLTGWVIDLARPKTPIEVEFDLNGVTVGQVTANVFRKELIRAETNGFSGFEYRFKEIADMHRSFVARARIAGTDIDLQKSPVLSIARPRLVRAVQQVNFAFHYLEQRLMWERGGKGPELKLSEEERLTFANLLLEGSNVPDILELQRRCIQPMQQTLAERYVRRDYSTLGAAYPESLPRRVRGAHLDRPVDVVVPVHTGYGETKRCLQSVLNSPAGCRYHLICILDNPDDARLRGLVRRFAAQYAQITLIENGSTKGFAETANFAMRLHRDRDVLLLHSDCEVHGDWLGRMQRAAYDGAGAGLVNPLTNQGEFLSYPSAGIDLPSNAPFEKLDKFARRVNRHGTVQIPAAMSFCLYIRRGCLDELGFFHNDQPSGGYYAEKFFSVNAAAQGWRSVVASDVFVKHTGNISFAKLDPQAIEDARDAFDRWCPYYQDMVTDFQVDDPALAAKRELDLARLEALNVERFCFVTHSVGGGTERHLQELSVALAADAVSALILYSLPGRRVFLTTLELAGIENLYYKLDDEWNCLVRDLKRLRVRHIHIHSNVEVDRDLFGLPKLLSVAYDITVHDYAWFCPRVNLVNHSGVYCGEPPVEICEICTGTDVKRLREISAEELASARRVYCPSADVRDRMGRQFQLTNLFVRPHPEWLEAPKGTVAGSKEPVTAAIIGRLSTHKGLQILRLCASHALEWNLPLRFLVIGATTEDREFQSFTNVEITGAYQEQEVDGLIAKSGAHVAFLPSVWPETYSYTLSIALRNRLFPVAFDLGAIAERMRLAKTGTLLALGSTAEEINQALLDGGRRRVKASLPGGFEYKDMLRDYYGIR